MEQLYEEAHQWIDREDGSCRQHRVERLAWVASLVPTAEYLTFPGGWITKHLYEEARYSFVYGQYLAVIVLGLAFIEHTIAGMLYAAGQNDATRAPADALFREALTLGWLSSDDYSWVDRARKLRNPVTHFRAPVAEDSVEVRSLASQEAPHATLEDDARHVMIAVTRLVRSGEL